MMSLWLRWGLTTTQNSISLKAQDRIWIGSRLTDTRPAENDWIGTDTDPAYRIDASLIDTVLFQALERFYEAVMQGILRHFSFDGNYYHFLNSDNKDGQINTDIFVAFLYLSVVKCILVASPGFVKDQFISYLFKEAVRQDCKLLLENRSKFMVVHSSSGHKYSLKGQYSVQLSKVKMCKIFIID